MLSFSVIFDDKDWKLQFDPFYCGENAGVYFFQTLVEIEENLLLSICKNKPPLNIPSLTIEKKEHFDSTNRSQTHIPIYFHNF